MTARPTLSHTARSRPVRGSGDGQAGPIIPALDAVGGRWALLVVEQLLDRPRFTDLCAALPKMSAGVRTPRLAELRSATALERRSFRAPAASWVYVLGPRDAARARPRRAQTLGARRIRADRARAGPLRA